MNKKSHLVLMGIVLGFASLLHLGNALFSWSLQISGYMISLWISWLVFVLAGYLSLKAFKFARE